MSVQDPLSLAVQRLFAISQRDMGRLQASPSASKQCINEAAYCYAIVIYGVAEAFESHLRDPSLHTHGHLSSLLNLLLRRSANPAQGESQPPAPSPDFGRAVIRALVALGCSDHLS